jgi:hypothetical protein
MTSETDNTLEMELNDRRQKLQDAVGGIERRGSKAEARLPVLRKQLGEAVLGVALGEVHSDEASKLRVAIVMAERDIEEAAGIVLEPAQKRENLINHEFTALKRRRKYRSEYDELKKLIAESAPTSKYFYPGGGIDPHYVSKLRELIQLADGDTTNADNFIAGYMRKTVAS